jgi:hypothetical protein
VSRRPQIGQGTVIPCSSLTIQTGVPPNPTMALAVTLRRQHGVSFFTRLLSLTGQRHLCDSTTNQLRLLTIPAYPTTMSGDMAFYLGFLPGDPRPSAGFVSYGKGEDMVPKP